MKEIIIVGLSGAVGGYLLCLARHRIAGAALVLVAGYEAKAKSDVVEVESKAKADVAAAAQKVDGKL